MIVDTARTAAELLAPHFAGREGERVAVLHLDREGRLLATSFAGAAGTVLPVRDILAESLRVGSVALIVARSRAGGDADPGDEDCAEARRLAEAAAAVGVRLIDHLVFAGGECRSFRELRLL
jgi:DNA repair protein RadC